MQLPVSGVTEQLRAEIYIVKMCGCVYKEQIIIQFFYINNNNNYNKTTICREHCNAAGTTTQGRITTLKHASETRNTAYFTRRRNHSYYMNSRTIITASLGVLLSTGLSTILFDVGLWFYFILL